MLAVDRQRLPARGEDASCRTTGQDALDGGRGGIDDVLGVVEHDQHVEIADRGQDVYGGPSVGTEAKRCHDGVGHGRRVRDASQLDEAGAEFGALCGAAGDLEGETCLADAARAGEGDEAGVADELGDELHVVVATDERRRHQGWDEPIRSADFGRRPSGTAWRCVLQGDLLGVAKGPGGFEPDLGERRSGPTVGAERVSGPVGAGQRLDQNRPPAFAQRLRGDKGLGDGDCFVVPTGAEQGDGAGFPCPSATFLQAAGLGADALDVCAVAVGGAVPQVEGGGEQVGGVGWVSALGGVDECFESVGVEGAGWYRQGVAAAAGHERRTELGA